MQDYIFDMVFWWANGISIFMEVRPYTYLCHYTLFGSEMLQNNQSYLYRN